jgi:hypothetical protein
METKIHREINPRKEPLTIEKLKTFEGFEKMTDEQAQAYLFEIKALSGLIVEFQNELALQQENNQHYKNAA